MNIAERLSFFASLYKVDTNPDTGMWLLYITIVILCIISYKLGFSVKLPLIKSVVIYLFLILGSTILTFLAIFLPVTEGLAIIALVLIIYRIRRYVDQKKGKLEG